MGRIGWVGTVGWIASFLALLAGRVMGEGLKSNESRYAKPDYSVYHTKYVAD